MFKVNGMCFVLCLFFFVFAGCSENKESLMEMAKKGNSDGIVDFIKNNNTQILNESNGKLVSYAVSLLLKNNLPGIKEVEEAYFNGLNSNYKKSIAISFISNERFFSKTNFLDINNFYFLLNNHPELIPKKDIAIFFFNNYSYDNFRSIAIDLPDLIFDNAEESDKFDIFLEIIEEEIPSSELKYKNSHTLLSHIIDQSKSMHESKSFKLYNKILVKLIDENNKNLSEGALTVTRAVLKQYRISEKAFASAYDHLMSANKLQRKINKNKRLLDQSQSDLLWARDVIDDFYYLRSTIVAQLGSYGHVNEYEVIEDDYSNKRAILITNDTVFQSRGRFVLPVKLTGKRSVSVKGGFTQVWNVYTELPENEYAKVKRIKSKIQEYREQKKELKKQSNEMIELYDKVYDKFHKNIVSALF